MNKCSKARAALCKKLHSFNPDPDPVIVKAEYKLQPLYQLNHQYIVRQHSSNPMGAGRIINDLKRIFNLWS